MRFLVVHRLPRFPLAFLALCLLSLSSPAAQQTQPPDDRTFVESIDVRLVQVEVVVTDSQGKRVPGLKREDFRLLVDGQEAPIDLFTEIREGQVYGLDDAATVGGGNSLLFFIDDYFTIRRYRQELFDRLLESLDRLGPRDQGAVVRFAGDGLEVMTEWTGDREAIRRLLEEARRAKSGELVRQAQLNGLSASGADITAFFKLRQQQVKKITSAVGAALRTLPEPEGRKLMVLLSSGWPYDSTASDLVSAREAAALERYSSQEALFEVAQNANLLGYTIYPLHLGLADSPDSLDLDAVGNPDEASIGLEPPGGSSDRDQRASLRFLAQATGGRFFGFAIAKTELPMTMVERDTRAYYVLGTYPQLVGDGTRHTFKVEVGGASGDGLKVRHREGYWDLTPDQKAAMDTEAALLLGRSSGPELEVRVGKHRRSGGRVEVPVEVVLPMDWVTMLPSRDGFSASLELRVAALDARGDRSEMPTIPIDFSGPHKPPPGSHSIYETVVKLRRKAQKVVLSLYDRSSGEMLTTTFDFTP